MANQNIYWKVKGILKEEPILKKELNRLISSLHEFSGEIPKESFEKHYREYEEFIEFLLA